MNKAILTLCFIASFFYSYAQKSPKRGIAYGSHSAADLNIEASGISWWYNWSDKPEGGVVSVYASYGVEFVPMVWGGSFDVNTVIANIPSGAKYLLAFNEPNFSAESNLTPQQAASLWPQIEQIAAAKNLEIVAPAVNYCGGGCNEPDAIKWLDDFFTACPACKVDYIAFHTYECSTGALQWNINNYKKYGRPIWLTEFTCWDPAVSAAAKKQYLEDATAILEADPDIYRYSNFTGRRSDNPSINILGSSGQLTTLGSAYINKSYGPVVNIPGKVEAENHYRRKGINMENTTDVGGGKNIGWFDPFDWGEYLVNISNDGYYNFQFRVASLGSVGKFKLFFDDSLITNTITFNPTGGYQTWATITVNNVPLKQGQHLLKLVSESSGFNINYFNTSFVGPLSTNNSFGKEEILIYPNPTANEIKIEIPDFIYPEQIQVIDVNGKIIASYKANEIPSYISLDGLPVGLYVVRILTVDDVLNKVVIKK